jgi:hypothetical protein
MDDTGRRPGLQAKAQEIRPLAVSSAKHWQGFFRPASVLARLGDSSRVEFVATAEICRGAADTECFPATKPWRCRQATADVNSNADAASHNRVAKSLNKPDAAADSRGSAGYCRAHRFFSLQFYFLWPL